MQFVDGVDAATVEHPVAAERALYIIEATAAALDHAHRNGVLHRDVKPANILLADVDGKERVLLTDFGIAAPRRRPPPHPDGLVHRHPRLRGPRTTHRRPSRPPRRPVRPRLHPVLVADRRLPVRCDQPRHGHPATPPEPAAVPARPPTRSTRGTGRRPCPRPGQTRYRPLRLVCGVRGRGAACAQRNRCATHCVRRALDAPSPAAESPRSTSSGVTHSCAPTVFGVCAVPVRYARAAGSRPSDAGSAT